MNAAYSRYRKHKSAGRTRLVGTNLAIDNCALGVPRRFIAVRARVWRTATLRLAIPEYREWVRNTK